MYNLYFRIRLDELGYHESLELATDGTLGQLMNVWTDEINHHDDQYLIGIL